MDFSNKTLQPLYDQMVIKEVGEGIDNTRDKVMLVQGRLVPNVSMCHGGMGMFHAQYGDDKMFQLPDVVEPWLKRMVALDPLAGTPDHARRRRHGGAGGRTGKRPGREQHRANGEPPRPATAHQRERPGAVGTPRIRRVKTEQGHEQSRKSGTGVRRPGPGAGHRIEATERGGQEPGSRGGRQSSAGRP